MPEDTTDIGGASSEPKMPGFRENFGFHRNLMEALKRVTSQTPNLRILDYGAGSGYDFSQFSRIQKDQAPVVAYEPGLGEDQLGERRGVIWSKDLPQGEFDMVVMNYSLHHIEGRPLEEVIAEVQRTNMPKWIVIVDYDFKGQAADQEQFRRAFVSDLEKRELQTQFAGDVQQCFEFHSRLGREDFERALSQSAYSVIEEGQGEDTAVFKFFVVGTPDPKAA